MPCMKPDSAAEPPGVRVRRLIRVSASGNVLGPSPSRATHRIGSAIGANSRPANPPRWQAAQASTIGKGLATRTAMAGISSAATRPNAENNATIAPPNAGVAPASVSSFGSQVNIE